MRGSQISGRVPATASLLKPLFSNIPLIQEQKEMNNAGSMAPLYGRSHEDHRLAGKFAMRLEAPEAPVQHDSSYAFVAARSELRADAEVRSV